MSHKSSVHGLFVNATGWTGKASPITAGNEEIHAQIAKEDVLLMKDGLMARRLKVTGRLKNPYPDGHPGISSRRRRDLYLVDPIDELEEQLG